MAAGIPLVILGGSDGRPPELPPEGADKHPLSGFKAVDVRVGGTPLVRLLVDRLRACGAFEPILIAGPAAVYREAVPDVVLVDTDQSVGQNVRAALQHLASGGFEGAVAFVACDVLPDVGELASLVDDYRRGPPCAVWFPLVPVPRARVELGAFGWKPEYGIVPERGAEPVPALPSHLGIVEPSALRMGLVYALLDIAYRTRNRPVGERRWSFLRRLFLGLLYQDLRHVLRLRAPNITWTVVRAGLFVSGEFRRGGIVREELERALGRALLRRRPRRRLPGSGVRTPLLPALSLAEDVDTEEEARALDGGMQASGDGVPDPNP